jgi:UDP-N-acetylglucosamine--N-acetylmuramyl-(pentapeptide) pyrophosphoryl-undecaprenol N-acetylglucosamine transferase
MNKQSKKIILAGSGSGGPVMPLLAVAEELKKLDPNIEFLFVGTKDGPAKEIAERVGIKFVAIPAAKFRRYFSLKNIADVFVFIVSLFAARRVIKDFKPDVIFGAGGFVAVPVSWMGWLMGVGVVMHQQDVNPGLANKLIRPTATLITTAFESTAKQFVSGSGLDPHAVKPGAKWVGNPVRPEFYEPVDPKARHRLGLVDSLPIVLAVGGATGAMQINRVIQSAAPQLVATHQIIHITGPGKGKSVFAHSNYHTVEFMGDDFPEALKLADVVVTRAGLSTISELSVTGKLAIVVPMPNTHQEDNADLLKAKDAAVVMQETEFTPENLVQTIRRMQFEAQTQFELTKNMSRLMPHDAAARIAKLIQHHVQ